MFGGLVCLLLVVSVSSLAGFEESNAALAAAHSKSNPLAPRWTFSAKPESDIQGVYYSADETTVFVSSVPTVLDGSASLPAQITALDPATGRARWSASTGYDVVSWFETVDGVVLAFMAGPYNGTGTLSGKESQRVWALTATHWTELWKADAASWPAAMGLYGGSLLESDDDSVTSVDARSGRTDWTTRVPHGCQISSDASSELNIALLARCGAELKAFSLDPRTGRTRWISLIADHFAESDYVVPDISIYGPDTVISGWNRAETLLSANGTPLAHPFVPSDLASDTWVTDQSGRLEHLTNEPDGSITVTDYSASTGTVLSRLSLPDLSVAGSSPVAGTDDIYVLVNLPRPLPTLGLAVVDIGHAHSNIFALPTVSANPNALALGPVDIYLSGQGPKTGSVVALSRSALSTVPQPPGLYAERWPQACTLLSSAELAAVAGHTYRSYGTDVTATDLPKSSSCRYVTTDPGGPGFEVDVAWDGISRAQTAVIFDEQVEQAPADVTPTALPGIGDDAVEGVRYDPGEPEYHDTATVDLQVGPVFVVITESGGTSLAPTIARMVAVRLAQGR